MRGAHSCPPLLVPLLPAAKIILKVYLAMIKRPIAHHDPALACAHVMLWHRAPIDVSEKVCVVGYPDWVAVQSPALSQAAERCTRGHTDAHARLVPIRTC